MGRGYRYSDGDLGCETVALVDISLDRRILANFIENLTEEQRTEGLQNELGIKKIYISERINKYK